MYKILIKNGVSFVCFLNGVKIPYQTKTIVTQNLRDPAFVTVCINTSQLLGSPDDPPCSFDHVLQVVTYLGFPLINQELVSFDRKTQIATVVLPCEQCDTTEAPLNQYQHANLPQ
jgi:hypothetical protein